MWCHAWRFRPEPAFHDRLRAGARVPCLHLHARSPMHLHEKVGAFVWRRRHIVEHVVQLCMDNLCRQLQTTRGGSQDPAATPEVLRARFAGVLNMSSPPLISGNRSCPWSSGGNSSRASSPPSLSATTGMSSPLSSEGKSMPRSHQHYAHCLNPP